MITSAKLLLLGTTALLLAAEPARAYYNPHTGRWLSRDPAADLLGHATSLHQPKFLAHSRGPQKTLYVFVLNRPTDVVDPDGRKEYLPTRRCGTIVNRAIDPDIDPGWWAKLHEALSRAFYPHWFVILNDGTRLTHGGIADDEDHKTAHKTPIIIPGCSSCKAFTQCMKDNWPSDSEYKTYTHNCGHAVVDTLFKCGALNDFNQPAVTITF